MFINLLLLMLCSDVQPNPGPDLTRHVLRNISIPNINVNSLRNKTDLISSELGDYDIICVTESKLDENVSSSDICIDNFYNPESFRKDRMVNRGGGILVYIRNNLLAKRRIELEVPHIECMSIEICSNNKKIILVCFYRQPNARISSWDHINSLFVNCIDANIDNVILLGDINVDLLTISENHKFSRLCELLGLQNVISEPTRITPSSSTLIDPILMSNPTILRDSFVLPNFCSDHCASVVEIIFVSHGEKSYLKSVWDFDNADYNSVNQHLQGIDWDVRLAETRDINLINDNINGEISYD